MIDEEPGLAEGKRADAPRGRVLLVEDEFLIRLVLAEVLGEAGFVVTEAATADAAATLVEGDVWFDLLLTDVQMPGQLDGIALARLARRSRPDLPIVFMTGRPDALVNLGRMGRRDALILKPYGPAQVLAVIQRLLADLAEPEAPTATG